MDNENLVSVNFEELTNFLNEVESLSVSIDDESVHTNLEEINENLKLLNEYLIPTDEEMLLLDEEIELETSEVLEDEPDLYLENLQSINENLIILNETVENQRTDELSDLQVKSYGSNIIILFLLIVYGLFKGASKIFGLVTKTI